MFEFSGGEKEILKRFINLIKDRTDKFRVKFDVRIDGSEIKSGRRDINMSVKLKGNPHVDCSRYAGVILIFRDTKLRTFMKEFFRRK